MKRNTIAITNSLLAYAAKKNIALTPLKTQKLLYFCSGIYLAKYDKEMNKGLKFEAWRYGPVNRDIFYGLKRFSNHEITERIYCPDDQKTYDTTNKDILNTIKITIKSYGNLTADSMVDITQSDNSAWQKAYAKGKGTILDQEDIKKDFLK